MKRVTGGVTTVFVYSIAGQLIAEYDDVTLPPQGSGGTSYVQLFGSMKGTSGQWQKSDTYMECGAFGAALEVVFAATLAGSDYQSGAKAPHSTMAHGWRISADLH